MAKTAVSQWDTTAANNTDINSISLAENVMQPPAVNDAFREMMAQIAAGVVVKTAATAGVSARFTLAEATGNGTNTVTVAAPASTADVTVTLPATTGTVALSDAAQTISGVYTFSAIPVLSGGAISFPATQVASANTNTLDDYEEGTFTPTFVASGATFSYASQVGEYTKIGDRVMLHIRIQLNGSGNTLTANPLTIAGLPFANGSAQTISTFVHWSFFSASYMVVGATLATGATTLAVTGLTAANASSGAAINSNALSATLGATVNLQMHYRV